MSFISQCNVFSVLEPSDAIPVSMLAGSELYKQIPVDLVPVQRLSLLSRLALRVSCLPCDSAGFAFYQSFALDPFSFDQHLGTTTDCIPIYF